ncbi:MAG: tetratricopeptide repeat protein [Sandaracinaceae bacterium]|nr:tetratricopeptide repeat protein [Sandaracinaceae bacterium]
MLRRLAAGLFTAVVCLAPLRVAAQEEREPEASVEPSDTTARAREYFGQGVELTRQDRWGEALVYFRRSLALVERPNTLFNIAGILVRLGRGRDAVEHYERYLRVAPEDDPDRAAALAALEDARAALAHLRLSVRPADAELRVDGLRIDGEGSERELVLDPGEHVIDLYAPRHHREVFRVSLLPGATGERLINLVRLGAGARPPEHPETPETIPALAPPEPEPVVVAPPIPAPPARVDRTPAHVTLVAGLATAVVGGAVLVWGLVERAWIEGAPAGESWERYAEAYDRSQILAPVGIFGLVLGAGLAGLGGGWLVGLSGSVGPNQARLEARGTF